MELLPDSLPLLLPPLPSPPLNVTEMLPAPLLLVEWLELVVLLLLPLLLWLVLVPLAERPR